jgi:ankyrin repeat protein
MDFDIVFHVYKLDDNSLAVTIHDTSLYAWLESVLPSLSSTFSMDDLLPQYAALRGNFDQMKSQKLLSESIRLFFTGFLQEGSVISTCGLQSLHERGILTEAHFLDIQRQDRSLSEDLDNLDDLMDSLEQDDSMYPLEQESVFKQPFLFGDEASRIEFDHAIRNREHDKVAALLGGCDGFIEAKTLCLALRFYDASIFGMLVEHGCKMEGEGLFDEPLYRAAKNGNMAAVRLLLDNGANIEGGKFCVSAAPLSGAASGGHRTIVCYLLDRGARVNPDKCKSPLSRALKHGHMTIACDLLAHGASLTKSNCLKLFSSAIRANRPGVSDIFASHIRSLPSELCKEVLIQAVLDKALEAVGVILVYGARVPDQEYTNISTPAAHRPQVTNRGINSETLVEVLCLAAQLGFVSIVECLVRHGAKVNPHRQRPPLYYAAQQGHLEVVRCLVAFGARINAPDPSTTVDFSGGHLEALQPDPGCHSPLAAAAYHRQVSTAKYLLQTGAVLQGCEGSITMRGCRAHSALHPIQSTVAGFIDDVQSGSVYEGPFLNGLYAYKHRVMVHQILLRHAMLEHTMHEQRCPTVEAIQAQERRNMGRRLQALVARSCRKLQDAAIGDDASTGIIAFTQELGTYSSVWKSGTNAIRGLTWGWKPDGIKEVVSMVQVAAAMRATAASMGQVCSKKE